jgi:putative transposase
MRRLDELRVDFPFAGSRMLRDMLAAGGVKVDCLHMSTLMKKMAVTRPNKVWATEITYIPMTLSFVYLIDIVDWLRRFACGAAAAKVTFEKDPKRAMDH